MTQQRPDVIFYRNIRFSSHHFGRESQVYTPHNFGITTTMMSTACYRGYVMTYRIWDATLFLDSFIFYTEMDKLPEINGIKPTKNNSFPSGTKDYEYRNLNLKIPLYGKLTMGNFYFDFQNGFISKAIFGSMRHDRPRSYSPKDIDEWVMRKIKHN